MVSFWEGRLRVGFVGISAELVRKAKKTGAKMRANILVMALVMES